MKRSIAPSSEERGFIALISAVVMSAILMSLMYTVSASSFYARIDAESIESKRVSLGLAESCINVALLALAISSDPTNTSGHGYAPVHEVIVVGADDTGQPLRCTIESVGGAGTTNRTIFASAEYRGAYSSVESVATVVDPAHVTEPHGTLIVHSR